MLLLGVAALGICPRAHAQTLSVVDQAGGALATAELRLDGNVAYVTASDVRRVLDGDAFPVDVRYRYTAPTGTVTLQFDLNDTRITVRIAANEPEVGVSGREPFILRDVPVAGANDLWLPVDLLIVVAGELLHVPVSYDATTQRLTVGPEDGAASGGSDQPTQDPQPADPGPATEMPYSATPATQALWTGLIVVVDPGHGGADPGAVGEGLVEKHITLDVANQFQALAQSSQGRVFLTRLLDRGVAPKERLQTCVERRATAFVSIHFNSSFSPEKSGFRLVVNNAREATASGSVLAGSAGSGTLAASRRLADAVATGLEQAGFRGERLELPLATVPELPIPSVHLEIAYLTNPTEASLWRDPRTSRRAAAAIWSGFARYRP